MTRSLRTAQLPPIPSGPINGETLRSILTAWQTQELALGDVRNAASDIAGGLYQGTDGSLIVGADARLTGRASSSLPTVLAKVGDNGQASTPQFLPITQTGGLTSTQDSGPVTAESDGVTAEIAIAAHTVQYGDGTLVSYNAGSVTGLDPNEDYRVYTDDANYAGGAVSYSATTNRQLLTASNARVFVGAVRTTPALATATITAATSANPVAFTTSAAHGWNTGNTVLMAGLPGDFGNTFNAGVWTITRTGASTFTIAVNGGAFAAYTSGGTATRQSTTAISGQGGPSGWVDMAFLTQF